METTHELTSWLSLVVICSISNSARRPLQNYCLPNLFSCQKSSAAKDFFALTEEPIDCYSPWGELEM